MVQEISKKIFSTLFPNKNMLIIDEIDERKLSCVVSMLKIVDIKMH